MKTTDMFFQKRSLCFGLLLFVFNTLLQAQTILPFYPILPDAEQGEPYDGGSFQFTLSPAMGGIIWSWAPLPGTPPLNATFGLTLNPTTGAISGNVGGSALTGVYEIRVTVSSGAITIASFDYIMLVRSNSPPICPTEHDFAIILDRSGSMNTITTGATTRWQELRDAVLDYLPILNTNVSSTDNIEVIFFNGGSPSTQYTGTFGGLPIGSRVGLGNVLFDDDTATPLTPSGATPMGPGMLLGIMSLTDITHSRNIILFTDGLQNVAPLYVYDNTVTPKTEDIGVVDLTSGGNENIKIFPIGVGGSDEVLLQNIANPEGPNDIGVFAHAFETSELDIFFTNTIPAAFGDCTPRIVDIRKGTFSGNETQEKFTIDSLVQDLTIRVIIDDPENTALTNYRLYKDGVLMPFEGEYDRYTLRYYIDLPYLLNDTTYLDGGGEWELRFFGTGNGAYEITALVDDEYVHTDLSLINSSNYYAGDDLSVNATVEFIGEGVEDITVTAFLLRPGEDMRDLAAETFVNPDQLRPRENTNLPGTSQSHLLAQTKIDSLLSNPDFLAQLEKEQRVITLTDLGNGTYNGNFPGNENRVTGTYQVIAKFEGPISGLGDLEGWESKWVAVDFSRPEDIVLNYNIVTLGNPDDGKINYQIQMTPVNKFGKKLGPGQSHRIKTNVSGYGDVILEDKLNGTYEGTFSVSTGSNPEVSVYIIDKNTPVLKQALNTSEQGFGISLHAGILRSLNNTPPLDSLSEGVYGEIDLSYRFGPRLALQLVGGRYHFDPDFDLTGGNLFLEWTLRNRIQSGLYLRLAGGGGLFKPDSQDLTYSLAAKAGLGFQLGNNLELGAEAGVYVLPDPDYQIGFGGLALRYFFN